MALREKWSARLPAKRVGLAASQRLGYHRGRATWWQNELEKAEADLRANGIELREMPITGGNRLQPMFDPQRQARVEECREKVRGHHQEADKYEAYVNALGIIGEHGDGTVEVDVADICYFELYDL